MFPSRFGTDLEEGGLSQEGVHDRGSQRIHSAGANQVQIDVLFYQIHGAILRRDQFQIGVFAQ